MVKQSAPITPWHFSTTTDIHLQPFGTMLKEKIYAVLKRHNFHVSLILNFNFTFTSLIFTFLISFVASSLNSGLKIQNGNGEVI